jgi:hypothetical protein
VPTYKTAVAWCKPVIEVDKFLTNILIRKLAKIMIIILGWLAAYG